MVVACSVETNKADIMISHFFDKHTRTLHCKKKLELNKPVCIIWILGCSWLSGKYGLIQHILMCVEVFTHSII